MSTKKLQILDKIVKQPDWLQTDETASDFIKNKPDINSAIEEVRAEIPESEIFVAEYDVTTNAEIYAAHQAGKVCVLFGDNGPMLPKVRILYAMEVTETSATFFYMRGKIVVQLKVENDQWSQSAYFTVAVRSDIPTDEHISSLVEGYAQPKGSYLTADDIPEHTWESLPDKPFGTEVTTDTIWEKEAAASLSNSTNYWSYYPEPDATITVGDELTVFFDGTEYSCVVESGESLNNVDYIFGNKALYTESNGMQTDTGEPFCIYLTAMMFYVSVRDTDTHHIVITKNNRSVIALDETYLPDTISRTDHTHSEYAEVDHTHSWDDLGDKPFYTITEMVDVFSEQSITASNIDGINEGFDNEYKNYETLDSYQELDILPTYRVYINENEYECVVREGNYQTSDDSGYLAWLGNGRLFGDYLEDTGEPFFISYSYGAIIWSLNLGETITVQILKEQENVKKLDSKFVESVYIVNVFANDEYDDGEGNYYSTYAADKTYAEIKKAIEDGINVQVHYKYSVEDEQDYVCYFCATNYDGIIFSGSDGGEELMYICVSFSNEVFVTRRYPISINEFGYIDDWYIPDSIKLPTYDATEDEGKILRIVNGSPAWTTIPNAEEAEF